MKIDKRYIECLYDDEDADVIEELYDPDFYEKNKVRKFRDDYEGSSNKYNKPKRSTKKRYEDDY